MKRALPGMLEMSVRVKLRKAMEGMLRSRAVEVIPSDDESDVTIPDLSSEDEGAEDISSEAATCAECA